MEWLQALEHPTQLMRAVNPQRTLRDKWTANMNGNVHVKYGLATLYMWLLFTQQVQMHTFAAIWHYYI